MRPDQPSIYLPNRPVKLTPWMLIVTGWISVSVLVWVCSPFASLPSPTEVMFALHRLWLRGLGDNLFITLDLIFRSLIISIIVSCIIAYSSMIAIFRPLTALICKLRFIGVAGLILPFTLVTGGGRSLKIALLVSGVTPFLVTAIVEILSSIPRERLDYLRVLGASEFSIIWDGVIVGTLAETIDAIRQNLAMAWAMITMVEGISRAAGGVGAMLVNQEKHWELAEIYAVLFVVLMVGLILDWFMGVISSILCPYSEKMRIR